MNDLTPKESAPKTLTITTEVPLERVEDLFVSAFEGGSNYWYEITSHNAEDCGVKFLSTLPVHPNCHMVIDAQGESVEGRNEWVLNRKAVEEGLTCFREKYPKHYGNWISEGDDAATGDVFLQCCLFGEVVFG